LITSKSFSIETIQRSPFFAAWWVFKSIYDHICFPGIWLAEIGCLLQEACLESGLHAKCWSNMSVMWSECSRFMTYNFTSGWSEMVPCNTWGSVCLNRRVKTIQMYTGPWNDGPPTSDIEVVIAATCIHKVSKRSWFGSSHLPHITRTHHCLGGPAKVHLSHFDAVETRHTFFGARWRMAQPWQRQQGGIKMTWKGRRDGSRMAQGPWPVDFGNDSPCLMRNPVLSAELN
jgi:hypothetical protein